VIDEASLPLARRPLHLRTISLLISFGAWFVAGIVFSLIARSIEGDVPTSHFAFDPYVSGSLALADVALAGTLLYRVRVEGGNVRVRLGLVRPTSWVLAIGLGIGVLVLTFIAAGILEPLLHGAREQGLTPAPVPHTAEARIGIVLGIIAFAVAAPVAEELFFRGALYAAYRKRLGPIPMALVSGSVFGAVHFLPLAFPELAIFGALQAGLYEVTGSILPGMLVHATLNTISLIAGYLA
jgi:membrane protease YdiL (CAAX protease family)